MASFGALAPWVVWVEFPRASVVAGADRFLRNSVLLGAAVALDVAAARAAGRHRLHRPLPPR
ncbi:MAG: hypothetical protein U0P30_05585 [Vicinamibacterales bacterium]